MDTSGGNQNSDRFGSVPSGQFLPGDNPTGQSSQLAPGLGQPISGPVPIEPVAANPNIQSGGMVGQFGQSDLGQPIGQPMPAGQPVIPQPLQPALPPQPAGRPAAAKEAEYVGGVGFNINENVPIIEVKEPGELPVEVEGWIERTEKDEVRDFQPVVHEGQVLVAAPATQVPSVTLPLTEEEMKKGAHQKIFESMRWMAEWCLKMIKQYHAKLVYGGGKTVK